MNMTRDTRIAIGLAALLLALAGIYWAVVRPRAGTSLRGGEAEFAIDDTAAIHKIVLTQRKRNAFTDTLLLERMPEGWRVNGHYMAPQPKVRTLLGTMRLLAVRTDLRPAGQAHGYKLIQENHIAVEAYDRRGGLLNAYWVGTEGKGAIGSLMLRRGAARPYLVEIPGFEGFLNTRYTTDEFFWRENRLYAGGLNRLVGIGFEYPATGHSLRLDRMGPAPEGPWHLNGQPPRDTAAVRALLARFELPMNAESFAAQTYPGHMATLAGRMPDLRLGLSYADGTRREIAFFKMGDDPNRYFAQAADAPEVVTVQQFTFGPIWAAADALLAGLMATPPAGARAPHGGGHARHSARASH